MIKSLIYRVTAGFAFGVLIGKIIMIIVSLFIGNGEYLPVVPNFREMFSYELTAVITQTVLTGFLGIVFATSTLLFEIEKWSLVKQCLVHFLVTSAFGVPIVYLCWRPQSTHSAVIMFINFIAIYVINWLVQYFVSKNDIRKINTKIKAVNE